MSLIWYWARVWIQWKNEESLAWNVENQEINKRLYINTRKQIYSTASRCMKSEKLKLLEVSRFLLWRKYENKHTITITRGKSKKKRTNKIYYLYIVINYSTVGWRTKITKHNKEQREHKNSNWVAVFIFSIVIFYTSLTSSMRFEQS